MFKGTKYVPIAIGIRGTIEPRSHRMVLLIVLISLLQVTTALAQERTVSGRVTAAEDGSELPGINVLVKGTAIGTVTDHHGRYSLTVKCSGSVLVFSLIGYITVERTVGGASVIDVQLGDDAKQLSDTMVTGQDGGIERCGG
ncbi:carboxypeptidase-like regulatory domain-containing protein [Chryseosolibacter histidini]|nr:carboxypeptidase-like regulatory domain-containing protein [Chryseosolibacter histidini]